MIYVTGEGDDLRANTELRGVPVYLDQWAIIGLAKNPSLGSRFVDAIRAGRGTLLFSIANLWEIGGPQQASKDRISDFLSAIGPRWLPVRAVTQLLFAEAAGEEPKPTDFDFLADYVSSRALEMNSASDPSFFDLGRVARWVTSGISPETLSSVTRQLRDTINRMRARYDSGDPAFEGVTFEPMDHRRATYVFKQLTFMMIEEAKAIPIEEHDFADLCHAIMALSFGLVATLDKKWRRRAKAIRHGHHLARVYYAPELEQFVADLETATPPWE